MLAISGRPLTAVIGTSAGFRRCRPRTDVSSSNVPTRGAATMINCCPKFVRPAALNDRLDPPPPPRSCDFFAHQTGARGLFLGGWDDPALWREAPNFANKLGPDRCLEFF